MPGGVYFQSNLTGPVVTRYAGHNKPGGQRPSTPPFVEHAEDLVLRATGGSIWLRYRLRTASASPLCDLNCHLHVSALAAT